MEQQGSRNEEARQAVNSNACFLLLCILIFVMLTSEPGSGGGFLLLMIFLVLLIVATTHQVHQRRMAYMQAVEQQYRGQQRTSESYSGAVVVFPQSGIVAPVHVAQPAPAAGQMQDAIRMPGMALQAESAPSPPPESSAHNKGGEEDGERSDGDDVYGRGEYVTAGDAAYVEEGVQVIMDDEGVSSSKRGGRENGAV